MSEVTKVGRVEKAWPGHEQIYVSTEQYCCKTLNFDNAHSRCSFHYHKLKTETFIVERGSFRIDLLEVVEGFTGACINIVPGSGSFVMLGVGDTLQIKPYTVHMIHALEDNSVIREVSTADYLDDSYRLIPGN